MERAGLEVIGLHSLLFDQPKLDLFGGVDQREELLNIFVIYRQFAVTSVAKL